MLRIPHNAFVFVGDGSKALVLRNEGDAQLLNLKTERVFTDQNPATHEQGTDRPGRAFSSVGGVRSSVGQTDWHDLEEHRFAQQVAAMLERMMRDRGVDASSPRSTRISPSIRSIRSRSIWPTPRR